MPPTQSKSAGQLGRVQHSAFDPVKQDDPVPELSELDGSRVLSDEHFPLQNGAVPLQLQTADVVSP